MDEEGSVTCEAVRCIAAVAPSLRKRSLLSAAQKVCRAVSGAGSAGGFRNGFQDSGSVVSA